jgi:hypothetical protein
MCNIYKFYIYHFYSLPMLFLFLCILMSCVNSFYCKWFRKFGWKKMFSWKNLGIIMCILCKYIKSTCNTLTCGNSVLKLVYRNGASLLKCTSGVSLLSLLLLVRGLICNTRGFSLDQQCNMICPTVLTKCLQFNTNVIINLLPASAALNQ